MSLIKTTLTSILLATLAACSSGGGNSGKSSQSETPKENPKGMAETPKENSEGMAKTPKQDSQDSNSNPKVVPDQEKPQIDEELIKRRMITEKAASEEKKKILRKDYPQGLTKSPIVLETSEDMKSYNVGSSIYNQKYSLLKIEYRSAVLPDNPENSEFYLSQPIGVETIFTDLPQSDTFSYKGVAFDIKENGIFNYTIDFSTKTGKGSVTGLSIGNVELQESKIQNNDMQGSLFGEAKSPSGNGNYNLTLYGPAGEEILGNMILDENNSDKNKAYGLAGSRE